MNSIEFIKNIDPIIYNKYMLFYSYSDLFKNSKLYNTKFNEYNNELLIELDNYNIYINNYLTKTKELSLNKDEINAIINTHSQLLNIIKIYIHDIDEYAYLTKRARIEGLKIMINHIKPPVK